MEHAFTAECSLTPAFPFFLSLTQDQYLLWLATLAICLSVSFLLSLELDAFSRWDAFSFPRMHSQSKRMRMKMSKTRNRCGFHWSLCDTLSSMPIQSTKIRCQTTFPMLATRCQTTFPRLVTRCPSVYILDNWKLCVNASTVTSSVHRRAGQVDYILENGIVLLSPEHSDTNADVLTCYSRAFPVLSLCVCNKHVCGSVLYSYHLSIVYGFSVHLCGRIQTIAIVFTARTFCVGVNQATLVLAGEVSHV